MKLFLILLFAFGFVAPQYSLAQPCFNQRDSVSNYQRQTIFTSVVAAGGRYYATGVDGGTGYSALRYAIHDAAGGKMLDTALSQVPLPPRKFEAWSNTLQPRPGGGWVVLSDSWELGIPSGPRAAIIEMDSLGRCTRFREYSDSVFANASFSNYYLARDLKPDGQGGWLLLTNPQRTAASPYQQYKQQVWTLTKLDSALNIVWTKTYGHNIWNDVACRILVEPDGYLLAGGQNNENMATIGFVYRAQLIKTDTAGNVLWTWNSPFAQLVHSVSDVVRTADGGYAYCGAVGVEVPYTPQIGRMYWKGWVEKLDSARTAQWNKTTSDLYFRGDIPVTQSVIRKLPNDDLVVAGSITDTTVPASIDVKHYGSLMRLSQTGTLRWLRKHTYGATDYQYIVHTLDFTPDDGFVMAGQIRDGSGPFTGPARGWIIKLDSDGNLCATAGIASAALDDPAVLLYPNPVRETLRIRWPQALRGDARILLSDLSGRVVLSAPVHPAGETEVSSDALPPGVYLYRVEYSGEVISRGKVVKQ